MSGRHTVSYCSDGESFGDYFCKGDCCQGFREAFGSSVCLDEGRFLLSVGICSVTGDGYNEPIEEEWDAEFVPIRFCPFCGAELAEGPEEICGPSGSEKDAMFAEGEE